jgi:thioredoxin-dependent peroxiredoxin
MARLDIGAKAPAFSLANQSGKTVSLKDLSGERFVIYFYPADDTPGCTKEACQFNDGLGAFRTLGVNVLGVSPDSAEKHVAFRQKYGLSFDLLSDPEKTVMTKYGAYGEKMMYGKKVNGVIRSTFVIGPTGKIEHAWYGVRADGHADKVLARLTS